MKSEFDAKKFVQLFMAGYVPRSKDEKKFVDKHVAQLHQDVNGNKDDVFKATNVPTHARPPYHGYNKGQDERMYEAVEQIGEALSDKDLYHSKSTMRVKGYPKMNEPMDVAQIQHGTEIVSEHEGEGGHVAQVRYSNVRKDYQVHHYTNGYNLGSHAISYHDNKKDAVDTAKYTTTVRNKDYLDRHAVLAGRVGSGKAYGVEPKSTDEILRARGDNIKESVEQIDEISKAKLFDYINSAAADLRVKSFDAGMDSKKDTDKDSKKRGKRQQGIGRAAKKLAFGKVSEAIELIEEEMTDAQMAKRERIVKSMKKKSATFEKRYGERAKDVMYATATKMAMEDLNYVNLEMLDEMFAVIEEYEEKEDREKKGLKHIESHAKKVREVTKKYPVAQRNESVIEQLIAAMELEEEIVTITFDNGEEAELERDIAESIVNIFNDLSEENQVEFALAISEGIEAFEHALAFIAEAYEGAE